MGSISLSATELLATEILAPMLSILRSEKLAEDKE